MPLSFSHPAVVLPLCKLSKKWISSTTLIFGSISPDLEYLLHLLPKRTYGHLYLHAWWFDLIITLVFAFVFHSIVRNPLIDNLPPFLSQRFQQFKNFNWTLHFLKHLPVIIISAWIGIYSHIIWDEFTHKGTYIVENYSFFTNYLTTVFGQNIFIYNLLQHTSSLAGIIVIGTILLSFKRDKNAFLNTKWMLFWIVTIIFALSLFTLKLFMISDVIKLNTHYFVILLLTLVATFLIGIVLTSFIYSFSKMRLVFLK